MVENYLCYNFTNNNFGICLFIKTFISSGDLGVVLFFVVTINYFSYILFIECVFYQNDLSV